MFPIKEQRLKEQRKLKQFVNKYYQDSCLLIMNIIRMSLFGTHMVQKIKDQSFNFLYFNLVALRFQLHKKKLQTIQVCEPHSIRQADYLKQESGFCNNNQPNDKVNNNSLLEAVTQNYVNLQQTQLQTQIIN